MLRPLKGWPAVPYFDAYKERVVARVHHPRRIQDIGKIKPVRRLVNLNADRKRFWLGTLKSIDDRLCNDSMPISLNHFAKEQV